MSISLDRGAVGGIVVCCCCCCCREPLATGVVTSDEGVVVGVIVVVVEVDVACWACHLLTSAIERPIACES